MLEIEVRHTFGGAGNQTTSAGVVVTMTTFQTYNPLIIPDTITGLISGTVPVGTSAGTYNISVSASNSGGTNHETVVVTVN